jgi:anaerobic magnesium-protoporphyrin IX monomethyl ester cyclase
MSKSENTKSRVLIITGFAPLRLPQLLDMGMPVGPISLLSRIAGKSTLQFTIPTVAPAVLATFLREHGVNVEITDYFIDSEIKYDADIVGISSTFMGVDDVKEITGKIVRENPLAVIALGGPLTWSVSPEEILRVIPDIDYIVMREGEQTFLELVRAIESGAKTEDINGLAFKRGGAVVRTSPRQGIACESIRRPDWKLMGIPSLRRLPVLPVETSRGCPFNCAYCSEVSYWDKPVRYRPINDVVDELVYNTEVLGINTFRFTDSCFSAPTERCGALCDKIYTLFGARGVPIKWSSYARISNLDYPLLEKMKRSGCVALDIGVESGSTEMLRSMGRNYSPETSLNIARFARELGIVTNFNVVIGFPGETKDSIMQTADLIETARPDTYASFLFYMAPNTRVDAAHERFHVEGHGLTWRHDTMTSEEAQAGMLTLDAHVKHSANFPGGEYFACYLASLGYSVEDTKKFYCDITHLVKFPDDAEALATVNRVVQSISKYW